MSADTPTSATAAELRRAFDASFAERPAAEVAPPEDLIEFVVDTTVYAVRTREISGLYVDRPITPVPTPVPELLGLAALRGSLLPVYDLAVLLGHAPSRSPRWLAVAARSAVGLAFERFERHVQVRRAAMVPYVGDGRVRHVLESCHIDAATRPVVSVASVLEAITARARVSVPRGERQKNGS